MSTPTRHPAATSHPLLTGLSELQQRTPIGRFFGSLRLPVRAIGFLLGQPRLWPFVIVPALINLTLFIVGVVLLLANLDVAMAWLWAKPAPDGWLDWLWLGLWYAAYVLVGGLSLVAVYILVLLLGGLVASPFNDVLSERTEKILRGRVMTTETGFWRDMMKSILSTGLITLLYVVLMGPILLLNFIPLLGSVAATILGGLVGAFFLALEYGDTAFARYGYSLGTKIALLRRHSALALGFGLGMSFLLWIPLLNFLCIPLAVIGGTALALSLSENV